MASDIDICNLALSYLGNDTVVTALVPADGTLEADLCARFYPVARDAVLGSHAWSFATKRTTLALLDIGDELPPTWLYAYALPNLCLSPISVLFPSAAQIPVAEFDTQGLPAAPSDNDTQPFVVETISDDSQVLLTNVTDAVVRYIGFVANTTKFTPLFIVAVARLLASMLAGPIIKGKEGMAVAQGERKFYEAVDFPRAAAWDSKGRKVNVYNNFVPDALKARA